MAINEITKQVLNQLREKAMDGDGLTRPEVIEILASQKTAEGDGFVDGTSEAFNQFLDDLVLKKMPAHFDTGTLQLFKDPNMVVFLKRSDHLGRLAHLETIQQLNEAYKKNPAMTLKEAETAVKDLCDLNRRDLQLGVAEGIKDFKGMLAPFVGNLSLSASFYRYFRNPEKAGPALCGKEEPSDFLKKTEDAEAQRNLIVLDKLLRDIVLVGSVHPKAREKLVTWVEEVGKDHKLVLSLQRLPQNYFIPPYGIRNLDQTAWYDAVNNATQFREILERAEQRIKSIQELKKSEIPVSDLKIFDVYHLKIEEAIARLNQQVGVAIAQVDPSHENHLIRAKLRFLGEVELGEIKPENTFEMAKVFLKRFGFQDPNSLARSAVFDEINKFFARKEEINTSIDRKPLFVSRTNFKPVELVSGDILTQKPIYESEAIKKGGCTAAQVDVDNDGVPDEFEFCINQPQIGTTDSRIDVFFKDGVTQKSQLIYSVQDSQPQCSETSPCYFMVAQTKGSSAPSFFRARPDSKTETIKPFEWAKNIGEVKPHRWAFSMSGEWEFYSPKLYLFIPNLPSLPRLVDTSILSGNDLPGALEAANAKPWGGMINGGIPSWPSGNGVGFTFRFEDMEGIFLNAANSWGVGGEIFLSAFVQNLMTKISPGQGFAAADPNPVSQTLPDGSIHKSTQVVGLIALPLSPLAQASLGFAANFRYEKISWLHFTAAASMAYYHLTMAHVTGEISIDEDKKTGTYRGPYGAMHIPETGSVFSPTVGLGANINIPLSTSAGWFFKGGAMCYWHFPSFGSPIITLDSHYNCPVFTVGPGWEFK